jgi:hypothetical protein
MVSSRIFIGEKRCGIPALYYPNVCALNTKTRRFKQLKTRTTPRRRDT